ncbi:hypothetical protein [Phreatobacter stygius]|uniref:Uncharacterized protein n=1 Tax=Phreatobacter stygius TaxID=1940610 RepID=A0A4D7B870_9HYPH|nr:hypothetical protein [Phreatobacter stygius]QCI66498.1 hypothetical protein E8M01_21055 [Phreatobacter stygius]
MVLFSIVISAVFAAAFASPRPGADVAVVVWPFGPASRAAEVIAAAEGSIVMPSRLGWIIIAQAERPDFVAALYGAGALVVFDPRVAAGCLSGG